MAEHVPVLLEEALAVLDVAPGGRYLDASYGRGGHASAIAARLGPRGRLLAFDRDPAAVAHGNDRFATDNRVTVQQCAFSELAGKVVAAGLMGQLEGMLFDIGVSSPQIDDPVRGFSFSHDGPLDMRMDPSAPPSAAQWLARAAEREIREVLWACGEERYARRIAAAIVAARRAEPIVTTGQLADIVAKANPRWERSKHPATRTFQAIRIHINRELEELNAALAASLDMLAMGGRLVVISFHSLEDRMVKRFIRDNSRVDPAFAGMPVVPAGAGPRLKPVGKAVKPGNEEIDRNPRARSAVLRAAERIA